ncbi:hypothetical protein COOONC_18547 [Cooperia oncophora]
MDRAVEEMAKKCSTCAVMDRDPVKTPLHPWEEPKESKWPEVAKTGTTTAEKTIMALKGVTPHAATEQAPAENADGKEFEDDSGYTKDRNYRVLIYV